MIHLHHYNSPFFACQTDFPLAHSYFQSSGLKSLLKEVNVHEDIQVFVPNSELALCIAKIADSKTDDMGALTAAQEIANACFDNIKALDGKQVKNHTTIALGTRVRD